MSTRLVILIVCVVFLDNTFSNRELVRWIHSPRITTWGTWGQPHFCPYNSWVGGMALKIDTSQGWRSDDTALNGVQLHCVNLDWIYTGNITSAVGSWGNYRKTKYCPRGYATGYQLRSEKNEAIDDDVGAVDFKLKCTNFDGSISYVINSEYALPWGQWSPQQNCPPQTVVCGISTQVESNQGDGLQDDTSLNNVDLACCKIPDPAETCKLETKWKTVTICSEAKKPCELKLATSIVEDEQQLKYAKFYERLGFIVDFSFVQKKLMLRSKLSGLCITSGKSLESIIDETEVKETKILSQINCEGIIQQLIITCGSYNVYTKEYRCVPNGIQGRYYKRGLFFQPNSPAENILWSYNCHFSGGNITSKKSQSEDCGDLCFDEKQCTHFTWTTDQNGTCWMKGTGVNLAPVEKYDEDLVCGWIERN